MCGIVGFTWNDPLLARKMADSIAHRGPDGIGVFCEEGLSFGHARLAILDIGASGAQPMAYHPALGGGDPSSIQDAPVTVVYNGELYNFPELRTELEGLGYRFTTRCDTECLLAAYLEWGEACVEKFNGMWAFCIHDRRTKKLFLSRDRLGEKPLYYASQNGNLAFASELKALMLSGVDRTVSEYARNHYFLLGYTPGGSSILASVEKLPPGENMTYSLEDAAVVSKKRYWNLGQPTCKIPYPEAVERVRSLIDESVKMRLLSDVPVGAFLSGGLDSSIISSLMSRKAPGLKTFSVGFDSKEHDETTYSRAVAGAIGSTHYEIAFSGKDVAQLFEKLPHYYDEPFSDVSMVPTFLVSSVAAREVVVCLSGTGADELAGGYPRYREHLVLKRLARFPSLLKKTLVSVYSQIDSLKGSKLRTLLSADDGTRYPALLSHLFRGEPLEREHLARLGSMYGEPLDDMNSLLCFDQGHYLPDDLLVKEDRATMANHLEGRIPFLDYRLVELLNSLPASYKIHKGGKGIFKDAFRRDIPEMVLKRQKQGFGVPIAQYLRHELKGQFEQILFDPSTQSPWTRDELKRLWSEHQGRKHDHSRLFWNVAMYQMWRETWQ